MVDNKEKWDFINSIDSKHSQRFIALDPRGYFLIRVEASTSELVVEHFSNDLDDAGRAVDPETGEVLGCSDQVGRSPLKTYRARSAKELGIQLTEGPGPHPLSRLDHALYLGRELQKAEQCLLGGVDYVQD